MAVTVVLAPGITRVVFGLEAFATAAPVQLWNTWPAGGLLALMETVAFAPNDPLPEPFTTVRVNCGVGGVTLVYVAVTVTFAAGITSCVFGEEALATAAPDQFLNPCPAGAGLADIGTVTLGANEPPPEPFRTVRVYFVAAGGNIPMGKATAVPPPTESVTLT